MSVQTDAVIGAFKAARSVAGFNVTYTQGATSLSLKAVRGQTQFSQEAANGMVVVTNTDDFLFLASELTVTPRMGDTVVCGSETFKVFSMGSDPQWRYTDQEKAIIRVHMRKV